MQQTTSFAHAAPTRKISPAIAALSAAAIASAVTLVVSLSSPAVVNAQDQGISKSMTGQCQMVARKLLVSTTSSGGTVRLRAGSYLSQPILLSAVPQPVVFPLARPDISSVEEVLTVEGHANGVIVASDVTNFRKVFDVEGVTAFNVSWKPLRTC